jgi:phasin
MAQNPQFEIPAPVRDLAERNVEQAHQAYAQFMDAARKAQEMVAHSSEMMTTSARDVQDRAMRYTAANMEASFAFARDLARVRDLKEAFELQQSFAKKQMEAYATQAQELTRLMAAAAEKSRSRG